MEAQPASLAIQRRLPAGGLFLPRCTSYLFNRKADPQQPVSSVSYVEQVQEAYAKAAQDYLTRFSTQAFSTLHQYEELAEKIVNFKVNEEPLKITIQHHQVQLLQTLLDNLICGSHSE